MRQGFMYLVAIIDWFSRYVLTWQLSNMLDGYFCLDALDQALASSRPEIFNTDRAPARAFNSVEVILRSPWRWELLNV